MQIPDLDPDTFSEALNNPLLLVEFWADWCPYSALLHPRIEAAAQARDAVLTAGRVDVEAHPGLADRWDIQYLPASALFRDDTRVEVFYGSHPTQKLLRAVDTHAPVAVTAGSS